MVVARCRNIVYSFTHDRHAQIRREPANLLVRPWGPRKKTIAARSLDPSLLLLVWTDAHAKCDSWLAAKKFIAFRGNELSGRSSGANICRRNLFWLGAKIRIHSTKPLLRIFFFDIYFCFWQQGNNFFPEIGVSSKFN